MSLWRRDLGRIGEDAACRYLRRSGYRILERNFSCHRGEIDIICEKSDCIVFVEVKTRANDTGADPEENITHAKRRKIETLAQIWLERNPCPNRAYRFDAVSVVKPDDAPPRVRHIPEAFDPTRFS